jgi:hypothetical protein
MENDDKTTNKSNIKHQAVCLLEKHLARPRAKKYGVVETDCGW